MFRKLSEGLASAGDRLASAWGSGGGTGGQESNVQQLSALGFDSASAAAALQATNGDLDRAAELLLAQGPPVPAPVPRSHPTANGNDNDDEDAALQQALQQSAHDEQQRRRQRQQPQPQTAAARKAGEAALARAAAQQSRFPVRSATSKQPIHPNRGKVEPPQRTGAATPTPAPTSFRTTSGGLSQHHPDVKVIPKLQDKSKEEQILRCADRLKSSPAAVDALHRAFTTLRAHPDDPKYRTIDRSGAVYQRTLASAPGAEDLLMATGYRRNGPNALVLDRSAVDPVLLFLAASALEQTKETDEYRQGKGRATFNQELARALAFADSSEAEALRRAEHLGQCPSEPASGRGALVQVLLGDQTTIRRRFDADDTLNDVLHWLGAHGSLIYDNVLNREWSLVDLNHYPVAPFDATANGRHTLQYLGCWPSGKLEVQPSTEEWKQGSKAARRTSRGLGSAPSEAL